VPLEVVTQAPDGVEVVTAKSPWVVYGDGPQWRSMAGIS
jgi:hypothetical protein